MTSNELYSISHRIAEAIRILQNVVNDLDMEIYREESDKTQGIDSTKEGDENDDS